MFTLNGYVAVDLPRTVTAAGIALLAGLVVLHGYALRCVLSSRTGLPLSFLGYCTALTAGWVAAGAAMVWRRGRIAALGWWLGSAGCLAFLVIYPASRFVQPAGLAALTGRWDVAPGTLAWALAAGFVALHTTVLSGVNVAYPRRQGWQD